MGNAGDLLLVTLCRSSVSLDALLLRVVPHHSLAALICTALVWMLFVLDSLLGSRWAQGL